MTKNRIDHDGLDLADLRLSAFDINRHSSIYRSYWLSRETSFFASSPGMIGRPVQNLKPDS